MTGLLLCRLLGGRRDPVDERSNSSCGPVGVGPRHEGVVGFEPVEFGILQPLGHELGVSDQDCGVVLAVDHQDRALDRPVVGEGGVV